MTRRRAEPRLPTVREAAQALLDKIDNITSHDFSLGGERPEREALRAALAREAVS